MGRLEDKVALITGAARGHAEAMARRFAAEGADIAMCDIVPQEELDRTTGEAVRATGRRALCFKTDVSDESQVNDMVERTLTEFGKIDILAPVVGIAGPTKDLHELTLAEWRQVQIVNVDSAFLCCKAVLPHMIERRAGRIILFSSPTGKQPLAHRSSYATSKMADSSTSNSTQSTNKRISRLLTLCCLNFVLAAQKAIQIMYCSFFNNNNK